MQLGFTKSNLCLTCLMFFFEEITDFFRQEKSRSNLSRFFFIWYHTRSY